MEKYIYILGERLFSLFCHQQNDLLMVINGNSLPLCYRCGFIYIGVFTAFLLSVVDRRKRPTWSVGMLFVAILISEWLISNIGFYQSSVVSRSATGFIGGAGAVFMLKYYVGKISRTGVLLMSGLPIIMFSIYTSQTAVLTLIIITFTNYWLSAGRAAYQIIISLKRRGEYIEIPGQN